MLGLVGLAILLHRIQNIVVPSRISSTHHTPHNIASRLYGYRAVRRVYSFLLPLDLSRTTTRLAFHLPYLYFLVKMLSVWTVLLLQTSGLFPAYDSGYIYSFGQFVAKLEMHNICWCTFCAICGAFAMEAFVRGLDGSGLGWIQMNANTSPFNLIGYAFLLHIYSSPITHVYKPPSLPSRPDKHFNHLPHLSIRKRWSSHRLFPTALASFLSLLHFHATLYSHYSSNNPRLYCPRSRSPPVTSLLPHHPPSSPQSPTQVLYSRPTGSATFPLLNYFPNIFETLLILTITLTILLNAVNWGVVLLRVGTASLESTGLRGWGNEMPPVSAAALHSRADAARRDPRHPEYGTARLGPAGVVEVSNGFGPPGAGRRHRRRGLANEVREVDIGAGAGSRAFGADLINWEWMKEAWRWAERFFTGVWSYIASGGKMRHAQRPAAVLGPAPRPVQFEEGEEGEEEEEDQYDGMYERFLRREDISDDEEDVAHEWDLADTSDSEDEPEQEDELGTSETVELYEDLGETTSAPVLLAHMTRDSELPLTRRRYGSLLGVAPIPDLTDTQPIVPRAPAPPLDETRRNCIICTSEAREIICWPCRCLSMCDVCREVLASRSSASKHRCPCCRQTVEGYSRIFIP
ncbi:hypothetical protein C8J57DRAFT_1280535 [Mycena rebaudengoi]|nr:hypothetical protein C8J57DRAFT_1280535 [Mycena rebaudengoi]